jgi:hypothetical protein
VVDIGVTNHMTGARVAFSELDTSICDTIKFDDGSVVRIEGCGTIVFQCKNGEHRSFFDIYFNPKLKTNILSADQLEELGYEILICSRLMCTKDTERRVLAKIPCGDNRLYVVDTTIAQSVCLLAHGDDVAWRWHTCLGHLNFQALKKLSCQG